MDTDRHLPPRATGAQPTSSPTATDLPQTALEHSDQIRTHTRRRHAKRPSKARAAPRAHNHAVQRCVLTSGPTQLEQITIDGVEYNVVDITEDPDARDYVMSLGYLQAPVVIAGEQHWSGFKPDAIRSLRAA
jgi:glutaredoxin